MYDLVYLYVLSDWMNCNHHCQVFKNIEGLPVVFNLATNYIRPGYRHIASLPLGSG